MVIKETTARSVRTEKLQPVYPAVGLQDAQLLWEAVRVSSDGRQNCLSSSSPSSGYICKRTESRVSKKYLHSLHICVHSNTIHDSQDVKVTQLFHPRMTD